MFVSALTLAFLSTPAFAGDKDKDGIPNKTDQCKTEPEDKDGFEDEDGCPDPDNDGDGLLDADDKCPIDAEDKDGFEDEDGCPDPDNDGDGVLDADDKCPAEQENDDTKDGCPNVDYDLLSADGWAPAVQELNDGLSAALGKGADGCDDAASVAEKWFGAHNGAELHTVFEDRVKRAPEGFDPTLVSTVIEAQAVFWTSARDAFGIYCESHSTWPGLSTKLDGVYKMAAKAE